METSLILLFPVVVGLGVLAYLVQQAASGVVEMAREVKALKIKAAAKEDDGR